MHTQEIKDVLVKQIKESREDSSQLQKLLEKLIGGDKDYAKLIRVRFSDEQDIGIHIDENGNIVPSMTMEDAAVFIIKVFFGEFEAIFEGMGDILDSQHDDRMARIDGKWSSFHECLSQKQDNYQKVLENLNWQLNDDIEAIRRELQREIETFRHPFKNPIYMFLPGQADKLSRTEKRAEECLVYYIRGIELRLTIFLTLGYLEAAKAFTNSCVEEWMRLFDRDIIEKLQSWNIDTNLGNRYGNNFWEGNTKRFCEMLRKFSQNICRENIYIELED